jgi:hypothetical protein
MSRPPSDFDTLKLNNGNRLAVQGTKATAVSRIKHYVALLF